MDRKSSGNSIIRRRVKTIKHASAIRPSASSQDQPHPDHDVLAQLDLMETSGLIRQSQSHPELEYLFRHALVQDAVYHTLVKEDRRAQHRIVGDTLERLYPDRLDEIAPVLALHFDEACDHERALAYYTRAGDFALHRYANVEAAAHYAHALVVAKRMHQPQSVPWLHLYTRRGRALEMSGRYDDALTNYRDMESEARTRNDQRQELAALMARATIHSTPSAVHDTAQGQALSERALIVARELEDREAESKILWNLMLLNQFSGHMCEAVNFGEQSLVLASQLDLREQLAFTLNDIVRSYMGVGRFERARQALAEAYEIWSAIGNLPMVVDNLGRAARISFAVGEYDSALNAALEARRISESIGNLWGQAFCRMFVGTIYFVRGEPARAITLMSECLDVAARAGLVMALVGTRTELAWICGTLGASDQGSALAQLALSTAEQRLPVFRSWALGGLARLQIMAGESAAAQASVDAGYQNLDLDDLSTHGSIYVPIADAELALAHHDGARAVLLMEALLERMHRVGMRSFLPDVLYLKAQGLLAQGQTEAGIQGLNVARAEAESLQSRWLLWQILASLSAIERAHGSVAEAQQLRAQSLELIAAIAANLPSNELRDSFSSTPGVRAVSLPSDA